MIVEAAVSNLTRGTFADGTEDSTGFFILDEPFAHLSVERIDDVQTAARLPRETGRGLRRPRRWRAPRGPCKPSASRGQRRRAASLRPVMAAPIVAPLRTGDEREKPDMNLGPCKRS